MERLRVPSSFDQELGFDSVSFSAFDTGGFEVMIDSSLSLPDELELMLRRRPWSRVAVRGLTLEAAGGGDAGGWWEASGGNGGGGNGGG
jgi:hypothetical protein